MSTPQIPKSPVAPYRTTPVPKQEIGEIVQLNPDELQPAHFEEGDASEPIMKRMLLTDQLADEDRKNVSVEDSGAGLKPEKCPRCDYELGIPYVIKPTPEDMQNFALSLQPGTGLRFTKTFTLPGNITVGLRNLSAKEFEILRCQMDLERTTDMTAALWFYHHDFYRLCWQLYLLKTPTEAIIEFDSKSNLAEKSTPEKTLLPECADWLRGLLANESLQKLLLGLLAEFNMTMANLEALSRTPDFYNGIATSA